MHILLEYIPASLARSHPQRLLHQQYGVHSTCRKQFTVRPLLNLTHSSASSPHQPNSAVHGAQRVLENYSTAEGGSLACQGLGTIAAIYR